MIELLLGLLVPVFVLGGILFIAVKRGLQMRELCLHGIETSGLVVEKTSHRRGGGKSRTPRLFYTYTDKNGVTHKHASFVSWDAYEKHQQGGKIEVVYSAKNPAVSAPKYLVDQARAALRK